MKRFLIICLSVFCIHASAQKIQRPKLVIGMVVDQMRWDYLYRYIDRYGNGGFRRLLDDGFSCENAFIPYTPTYTAAGHASVYTGSVPALNGIPGNNWYSREEKKVIYCTDDTVHTIGSTSVAGNMSPRHLWSNTITDELRMATNFQNKTISIALKDRGSILPGGFTSNGSYWFDNATGGWITSSFYMNALPAWIQKFNDRHLPDEYLKQNWNTLYPIQSYVQSFTDSNRYEGRLEDRTFPHMTSAITSNKYESFRTTPFGNTYTLEMAKAAIENEQLGKRNVTDFLSVSLSSTDYIGHTFGPNSIEVEDTYLRLDQDLASFLTYLDNTIGKGQYLLFLTADHGVANNPYMVSDYKMPSGALNTPLVRRVLDDSLSRNFLVRNLVSEVINYQVYLDDELIAENGLDKKSICKYIINFLMHQPAVANAVVLSDLNEATLTQTQRMMLTNGYNQKLSGDIQFMLKPQWFESFQSGTTHGSWNPYDAHIPLLWFGWHVKKGALNREVYMTDIAATVAAFLHIQMPTACIGKVITEVKSDK
ncbi:MAG: alkaline phosphatase PafA [Flavisolibacter sp.]